MSILWMQGPIFPHLETTPLNLPCVACFVWPGLGSVVNVNRATWTAWGFFKIYNFTSRTNAWTLSCRLRWRSFLWGWPRDVGVSFHSGDRSKWPRACIPGVHACVSVKLLKRNWPSLGVHDNDCSFPRSVLPSKSSSRRRRIELTRYFLSPL
jgi:hypothetical protein